MNKFLITLLTAISFGMAVSTPAYAIKRKKTDTKSIVILYENDVHCEVSGYSKLAGLRDAIQDTAWCCCVSSGDFIQGGTAGSLSKGQYIVDIMKNVGYASITLGNHEFDYGNRRMSKLIEEIHAPVTCVNYKKLGESIPVYKPYVMHKMGDKTVAFVGVLTPTTIYTEEIGFFDKSGKQTHELSVENIYEVVQNAVDAARQEGADYVIILSHLGEDDNTFHVTSHSLIKATNGIDALLDGHTHSVVPQLMVDNKDGKPVAVTQTGTRFANVGKLVIKKNGTIHTELIPTQDITFENEIVKNATDSIVSMYEEIVNRHVCTSEVPIMINDAQGIREVRSKETNSGDLVSESFKYVTGADVALANGGGIRAQFEAGEVKYGDIISLLPYENQLTLVEVKGQKILDLLNACTKSLPLEDGDFPQVAGMKYTIELSKEPRVTEVMIESKEGEYKPLDTEATYTLGTINYCVTGGGFKGILKDAKIIESNIMLYNDALVEYLTKEKNGHIGQEYAKPKGRIIIKE